MLNVRSLFGIRTPLKSSRSGIHFLVLRFTVIFVAVFVGKAFSAGLVGFWNFDEGTGLIANDSSGNNNTGVSVNEPQWTIGKFGAGLSFDGVDDYVEIAHSDSLNLTRELTVSAWIYNQAAHEPALQESEYHIIAAKGWAPDRGGSWTLAWDRKTNSLFFCARKNTNNGHKCVSSDFGSLTNDWHLVTTVFSDGKIQLYVDGILAAGPVSLGTAKINNNTEHVHIGGLPSLGGYSNDSWHGLIDDVQISNVALNQTEIAIMSGNLRLQRNFDFSVASSGNLSVGQASTAATSIHTALLSGTSNSVSFSVSGLPRSVSASFSSSSCTPTCSTILTIATGSTTPAGAYPITVNARGGGIKKSTSFNLLVTGSSFSLSNSGDKLVDAGSSTSNTINATLTAGNSQAVASTLPVTFSASGLPSGAAASFSQYSCSPSCSSTLTISTSSSTPGGTFTVTVAASGVDGVFKTTTFRLSVSVPTIAPPTITPNGGTYAGSVPVTLQTGTEGASIYYTTDGSTPTRFSALYTGVITLTNSAVLKAKAVNSGSNSSSEASAAFTIVSQPSQLNLTWQDNSTNENGFQIERKVDVGGSYAEIDSVGMNINSYMDTGLVSGTTYCYRVRAVNSSTTSSYSNDVCAAAP